MSTHYIPKDHHAVTPYLVIKDAAKVIDFLKKVFDATDLGIMKTPEGLIAHAEVKVGDSIIMISDAPVGHALMPAMLYIYVPDTDATYKKAISAGATSIKEPADQPYGDRNGGVSDSSGNMWWIGTHIKDVSHEDLLKVAETEMKPRK